MATLLKAQRTRALDIYNSNEITESDLDEILSFAPNRLKHAQITEIRKKLIPLINLQFDLLRIPRSVIASFEPSQLGTIIGTLIDACIPELINLFPDNLAIKTIGLSKAPGQIGDRENYPDFHSKDGFRFELKMLFVDCEEAITKRPPTPLEPSARLTQKVTLKNVEYDKDLLLILAYSLKPDSTGKRFSPTIINIGLFSVFECILARDIRLSTGGGRWFGDFETPTILSKSGKLKTREHLNIFDYGRKESENKDFNEDTNFGKLKRIPLKSLQNFIRDCGCNSANSNLLEF